MKKETLEEATQRIRNCERDITFFELGTKWQQEISYSEDDLKDAYEQGVRLALISQSDLALHKGKFPTPDEWFKQFKKK